MRISLFVTLLTLCWTLVYCQDDVVKASTETLQSLDAEIRQLLNRDRALIGGFVRLSFHDCVGKGRCDGCINHDEPDNAGMT